MSAKQMMKLKLNDFHYRRWLKLYERSEALAKRREEMGREGMKIAQLENKLFNEWASTPSALRGGGMKLLCRIGLHRWTEYYSIPSNWTNMMKERRCTKCGRVEITL